MKDNKNLVAYCGLHCPTCYKMIVSKSAKGLKEALENSRICGTTNEPSDNFINELNNLISLHCPKVCKEGGGNQDCKIRKCCIKKSFEGCWECETYNSCENLSEQFKENICKIKKDGKFITKAN